MFKDKIELSFAAFERWERQERTDPRLLSSHEKWDNLCREAEKKEPMRVWIVIWPSGGRSVFDTEEEARVNAATCNGKVAHFLECVALERTK